MISIIMPVYNESKNIDRYEKELFTHLNKLKEDFEIILVNDGSTDDTRMRIEELQSRYKRIICINHPQNMGLGMAIRTGIKHSIGDKVITLDGDLTFHPKYIEMLYSKYIAENIDCVMGSPELAGYKDEVPRYRVFLSRCANYIYSILLGSRITAMSPIFRIYNGDKLRGLTLQSTGFDINAEIIMKFIQSKYSFIEVPIPLNIRIFGVSKINNVKEVKNHIKLYMRIILWKLNAYKNYIV